MTSDTPTTVRAECRSGARPRMVERSCSCRSGLMADRNTDLLARSLSHTQGAGVIGDDADQLLRAALVQALLADNGVQLRVVLTRGDLERILGEREVHAFVSAFAPRLHVVELLEDAIEYLEAEARSVRTVEAGRNPSRSSRRSTTIWFATPGIDADVVHQTIEQWQGLDMIALLTGPWPYGPTHFIQDGFLSAVHERWPSAPLTRDQAAEALHARINR